MSPVDLSELDINRDEGMLFLPWFVELLNLGIFKPSVQSDQLCLLKLVGCVTPMTGLSRHISERLSSLLHNLYS